MDTYSTIAEIARTDRFMERVTACAAQQGAPGEPWQWTYERRYTIASSPGWAEAVDSWHAGNPARSVDDADDWAENQGVISDQMILATVQPLIQPLNG